MMPLKVAVIAPMVDESQYHLDFTLKLRHNSRELTLATLLEAAQKGYQTSTLSSVPSKRDMMPAAGFYLAGLLRKNGYQTILTYHCDEASLLKIAAENPVAVCLSTTMILTLESLRNHLSMIRKYLPGCFIIIGGVFVWKSYQFGLLKTDHDQDTGKQDMLIFQPGSSGIDVDMIIAAPHGRESLLQVLKELEKGSKARFDHIPNLAWPNHGEGFAFTERKEEKVDYNVDFTLWDYIDELPGQIPVRTSIGCPYRCRFCDFYQLYPRIFFRSKESLMEELKMIKNRIGNTPAIVHASDDNVFINARRVKEVTEAIILSGIPQWMGFMRASAINESNIEYIRRSGLLISLIGVESGDKGQLDRMNKAQNLPDVKNGIELLDRNGITVLMTYVVGFPGETSESISNTAQFINDLDIGYASSGYLIFPLSISPFSDLARPEFRSQWKIKGFLDRWSHYTMNSDEAPEYGYQLFKQIKEVPYHYTQERTFYNGEAFTDFQRRKLFGLRQKLTIDMIENAPEKKIEVTLAEISKTLGLPFENINKNFRNEVSIQV